MFYDYDEIDYLTNCNFRRIPAARNDEDEMAAEPWYPVAQNDIFPEEFARFLLTDPKVRDRFMAHHADLLDSDYWRATQDRISAGHVEDIFPYPESIRFSNARLAPPNARLTVTAEFKASNFCENDRSCGMVLFPNMNIHGG